MAEFLPADHWKTDVSSRKHTRPAPKKDASWDFLRGAGPSAAEVVSRSPFSRFDDLFQALGRH